MEECKEKIIEEIKKEKPEQQNAEAMEKFSEICDCIENFYNTITMVDEGVDLDVCPHADTNTIDVEFYVWSLCLETCNNGAVDDAYWYLKLQLQATAVEFSVEESGKLRIKMTFNGVWENK